MLNNFIDQVIKFPIWKNDGKSYVKLNELQKHQIKEFLNKVKSGIYKFEKNPCLCGKTNEELDVVISEKDRYGIPCEIVLCRNCGLIRLKERLDNYSTVEFYKNDYRNIYVGKEIASEEFFLDQIKRGETFLILFDKFVGINNINTVFEIGCGAGGILYPFYLKGKKVSGCDFNENYLKFGIEKGLDLYLGEVNTQKTPHKSQDLVILSHVLEHLNNPIEAMNNIIELVSDGKYLIVEVPGIFYISRTYFNPILYFQNAHVYNYYYYYLKIFFETLGLEVLYGDERCTFLLKKPLGWTRKRVTAIFDKNMQLWAKKVEVTLKKYYFIHLLKLNPYYIRRGFIHLLDVLGLKDPIKTLIAKINKK